jgi:hypothetical protein
VVESSLGVPTGCAGKLRWQTAGMFGEAAMAEPWDGVGKAAMAEPWDVWFGLVGWFVEVDFIRLWVGHGVTP